MADALSYAHEQGVVHRDIKPENILLSRGHAVVADFGIAKAIAAAGGGSDRPERPDASAPLAHQYPSERNLTQASTLVGTPAYMAPEQAARSHVDHRADLYAWGIVAYEVLAGRHPFDAGGRATILVTAHRTDAPRPLCELAPGVPPRVGALVMRCLSKAPADRPASASEIVSALDAAVMASPNVAPRITTSRGARFGVIVASGAAIAIVAGLYWRSGRAEARHVVVGTGQAAVDVPAVQAAVDQGGEVVLEGHLSFRLKPSKLTASSYAPIGASAAAEVLVSKAVTISGARDEAGTMTTIDGGTIPFYVDAPGKRVAIQSLRFVRPIGVAIRVHAAHDMEITGNTIEGVTPFAGLALGFDINTSGMLPQPNIEGSPEKISGALTIKNNDIDASGGSAHDYRGGIHVFSVGRWPRDTVDLLINADHIRNTTGSAIIVRRVHGRSRIIVNTVVTSETVAPTGAEAVRIANTGSYLMAANTIECRWADCIGIAAFSQFREWPFSHDTIEDNTVIMASSRNRFRRFERRDRDQGFRRFQRRSAQHPSRPCARAPGDSRVQRGDSGRQRVHRQRSRRLRGSLAHVFVGSRSWGAASMVRALLSTPAMVRS